MDQLEGAPPGHEPVHRPFRRLLAILVPVDGHDGRAVLPGLGLPTMRHCRECREVHFSALRPTNETTDGRERERETKGEFCPSSSPFAYFSCPTLPCLGRGLLVPCCRDQSRPKPAMFVLGSLCCFCQVWTQCGCEGFLNFLWLLFPRLLSKGCRREDHLFNDAHLFPCF